MGMNDSNAVPAAYIPSPSPSPNSPWSANANGPKTVYRQDPIAVVGLANRLPGHSTTPTKLWDFLLRGGIAENAPPRSRFSLAGHYDGSLKPHTVKTPGAMFLEDSDPADFDAAFFNTSRGDAIAMDPQQRMLLEVIYEGLENAGIGLESVSGDDFGCFVASYAVDYMDMQNRDPEDRAQGITIGAGRAILSNRISHFLNIKGASMTIDTACSGSMVSVDVACKYLQTRQLHGAIVAGCNLYMSPDQNQDMGAMRTASSATGKCHTFDAKADGYCKSEGINCVILKRLEDAIRDGDPIRAVIRGTSTNSDGWTPGIASPSAEAQAMGIRAAYAAAGIEDFHDTGYLECHGTGTLAGDPVEVAAAASVLTQGRTSANPLIIGSIKSNLGHGEPAAGVSGLIKAVLAVESGIIPGNPTFRHPNPKIDFEGLHVQASRTAVQWPNPERRVASVNSFGYGGSNAHAVIQDAQSYLMNTPYVRHTSSYGQKKIDDFFDEEDEEGPESGLERPTVMVFSANDEASLKSSYERFKRHLSDPRVSVKAADLAFTLSEHRSRHFYRGYILADNLGLSEEPLVIGKKSNQVPKVGFIFTGQGAQWSQMGKGIIDSYDGARPLLQRLDEALQSLPTPPSWSLLHELYEVRSPDHLRKPEFSQPLVTALQLVMLAALIEWGVRPKSVVGHSSGEIAAAVAAGFLTEEDAIKIAFYRGEAAKQLEERSSEPVGMMAAGLGAPEVQPYIEDLADTVQIACYNSPGSVTLSGKAADLEIVKRRLQNDSHFARLLQVNLAYHSRYMQAIGERYQTLVAENCGQPLRGSGDVGMFSSVTGGLNAEKKDAVYWKTNMISPVRFNEACSALLTAENAADFMVELGPSGALGGPFAQIKKALSGQTTNVQYHAAAKRGPDSSRPLFDVVGRLFICDGSVSITKANSDNRLPNSLNPAIVVDLPNYAWNHSTKYWYESESSEEWRYRRHVHHDLLGSKILSSPWSAPTFAKTLDLKDLPWLKDHKMGQDIVFPAAAFCAMAIEALYQTTQAANPDGKVTQADQLCYRIRNATFDSALLLDENEPCKIKTILTPCATTSSGPWYQLKIISTKNEITHEHCAGLIRLERNVQETVSDADAAPLGHTTPGRLWYKAQSDAGYGFGPLFQKHLATESTSGSRSSRSLVDLSEPPSTWTQSPYPLHPTAIDGCFQTVTPSLVAGIRSNIKSVLIPAIIDDLVIYPNASQSEKGVSITTSEYVGKGRPDDDKNYMSNATVHDPATKQVLLKLTGLRYHRLDTGFDPLAAHTFNRLSWKPDVTFFSPQQKGSVKQSSTETADELLDLLAHKKPGLRILEVNLEAGDDSSIWFGRGDADIRAAYLTYNFVSADATAMVNVEAALGHQRNVSVGLADFTRFEAWNSEDQFDLVIIKAANLATDAAANVVQNGRLALVDEGYVILLESQAVAKSIGTSLAGKRNDSALTCLPAQIGSSGLINISSLAFDNDDRIHFAKCDAFTLQPHAPLPIKLITLAGHSTTSAGIAQALQQAGHSVEEHTGDLSRVPHNCIALVLDELSKPLLTEINAEQWGLLQDLITSRSKVLWLTTGSQMNIKSPDRALVHGLFRTIRAEDPGLSLTTLDVESPSGTATNSSILALIERLSRPTAKSFVESEYVERQSVLYTSRVLPDESINQLKKAQSQGEQPILASLHEQRSCVRLRSERIGTLEALHFGEIARDELPMQQNHVEVEIYAAGVNFKDVAVTMGIVPENEHLLGLEGAGVVRRVAGDVTKFKPGDRVVIFVKGTFANRVQVSTERTHRIPDSMSFIDASTIPAVYLTSMYSLFDLASLQKGQSVLIHSAAGGVGISAIRLAQYKGAKIYVTVGDEGKREFLERTFGIPRSQMFSSRSTRFAKEVLEATNGLGIDVILNSLTGELLDESWRICADGGTMIEIGKRDILDRKQLSMEPFDRNCSYRALDFSHKQISDELIARLLSQIFELHRQGHVTPVHPIKTFSFTDIPSAFAFIRSGKHIGKVVISDREDADIRVPIRPATKTYTLRSDGSYLIVGGLKGLCGSLAVSMAAHGARHLVVMSRSGIDDPKSGSVVKDCLSHGCEVHEAKGDVSSLADVRSAFEKAPLPVRGVIQGAMVLRDKPFETMTIDDYHTTLSNKLNGTLHLHSVARQLGLNLEFFTMLASISGVVGQKGQANYAAANVFMDAFAGYRQSMGLPANSVDLGVIEDVGYVAEQGGMEQHFDDRQWTGINEHVLRNILGYSILEQSDAFNPAIHTQLITGIPVPQPEDSGLKADARFSALFIPQDAEAAGPSSSAGGDAGKEIKSFFMMLKAGADAAALQTTCVNIVNKQFTKTLRLSEPMEPAKALTAYGLDSLAAVEFRNWVRNELGTELTTLEINNSPSLFALCEKIVARSKG